VIRILIADDHAVVRRGLKHILSGESNMTVIGEASDGRELIRLVRTHRADAVIIDITMSGGGGLEALRDLRHELPRIPVLVLSVHPEDQYAVRCLKAGAAGYLTKDSAPEELTKAIRRIVTGGRYVSASLAEQLAMGLSIERDQRPHERLSDREYQVLCLLASGKSVSDIAGELALSVKTISTYRARILEKTGLKNNSELTRYAFENRLVS
jgi:two-component system, NarL family, invasion response regulator UvrY